MNLLLRFQGGAAAAKAQKAAQAVTAGLRSKKSTKVRKTTTFHRPKTLKLARKPAYPRKSAPKANKLDQFQIIKCVPSLARPPDRSSRGSVDLNAAFMRTVAV